jgi:hypothetical protein
MQSFFFCFLKCVNLSIKPIGKMACRFWKIVYINLNVSVFVIHVLDHAYATAAAGHFDHNRLIVLPSCLAIGNTMSSIIKYIIYYRI